MQMSLQHAATVLLQHLLQHLFYFILHVRPVLRKQNNGEIKLKYTQILCENVDESISKSLLHTDVRMSQ